MKAMAGITSYCPANRPPIRSIPFFSVAMLAFLILASIFPSCGNTDRVEALKKRSLDEDERYLVDYYIKIIEFEKEQFESQEGREKRRTEREQELDTERLNRVLARLEKDPQRWLAIYDRIGKSRSAKGFSNEGY